MIFLKVPIIINTKRYFHGRRRPDASKSVEVGVRRGRQPFAQTKNNFPRNGCGAKATHHSEKAYPPALSIQHTIFQIWRRLGRNNLLMFVTSAAGVSGREGQAPPPSDGLSTRPSRRHPVCHGWRRCRSVHIPIRPHLA